MKIRILERAEAARFQELRLRGLKEDPSAFASSFEEERDRSEEDVAAGLAAGATSVVLGAFEGDRLAGILGLKREEEIKLAHKVWIWGMYVLPEFRGRGAGRALVGEALRRAREMPGLRRVYLGVNAANGAARRLYEATGFREYACEKGFMLVDGELQDEIMMACDFGEEERELV